MLEERISDEASPGGSSTVAQKSARQPPPPPARPSTAPSAVAQLLELLSQKRASTPKTAARIEDTGFGMSIVDVAEAARLKGENEELRVQLENALAESRSVGREAERKTALLSKLSSEYEQLKDIVSKKFDVPWTPLPQGIPGSSGDIIANLNEHLIQVLADHAVKSAALSEATTALEDCRRELAVISHQQSLLYSEHAQQVAVTKEARLAAARAVSEQETANEQARVYEDQFGALQSALTAGPDEQKRELGEAFRKITVYKVNQLALTRRYTIVSAENEDLAAANTRLQGDSEHMSKVVLERVGALTRQVATRDHAIEQLEKELASSVSEVELKSANRRCESLAAKLRAYLDRHNGEAVERHNGEPDDCAQGTKNELATLKKQLIQATAREDSLTAQLLVAQQAAANGGSCDSNAVSEMHEELSLKRVQTLETQLLNERQRCELLQIKLDSELSVAQTLERRNVELEQKFNKMAEMQLATNEDTAKLQDDLDLCVTQEVHSTSQAKIKEHSNITTCFHFKLT